MKKPVAFTSLLALFALSAAVGASGAAKSWYGRVSLYGQAAASNYDQGGNVFFSDTVMTFTFRSAETGKDGLEYGLDVRGASYPSAEERNPRLSIYDGFAGAWFGQGHFHVRLGQMWLNELGSLGSIGGGQLECRSGTIPTLGRFRFGVFGGAEPKILEAGYVSGVSKFGAYVALDGDAARRHVLSYVSLRDSGLTERSVILFNNYLPLGRKFFLYQAAEYDLLGPSGQGSGHLTYFFANARYSPAAAVELQATYHRGLSFDTRSITDDRLNGRPLDQRALEGYLYESVGGRLTLNVVSGVRIYGGYAQDRNNLGDGRTDRTSFGLYATDLFKTGLEVNLSDWRMKSEAGSSYDSWYASLGRNFGRSVYVEGFYSSSVSVFRLTESGGYRIDSYPKTQRFGFSSVLNVFRTASIQLTAERTVGSFYREFRFLGGISYRF
jgi:hypothetical protein